MDLLTYADFGKELGEVKQVLAECLEPLMEACTPVIKMVCGLYDAAKENPRWVKIYNRTKKKRIRKKYAQKIWRAYKEKEG